MDKEMITVVVSFIVSLGTTAGLYYILHRAAPAATQTAIASVATQAKADVTAEVAKVEAKL
jgi:hypothetical protein